MPVITGGWYTTTQIQKHPDWLHLFGDNAQRSGRIGQAAVCRDEPNCIGVRTKWLPNARPAAFFSDNDYARCVSLINEDVRPALEAVQKGRVVVLPLGGIGHGYANLEDRAPGVFRYLHHLLKLLVANGEGVPIPPSYAITAPRAATMQNVARGHHAAMVWTIFRGSIEFPGLFVARPTTSTCLAPMLECLVDGSLENLRRRVPPRLKRLAAHPSEGPDIVETWI